MKHLADVIPFRTRATADDLTDYLCANVVKLQQHAMHLQNAGLRFGEVVVPKRFSGVVSDGEVTILGRKVIAGDVDTIGVVTFMPKVG